MSRHTQTETTSWFIDKVLPSLFVALTLAVIGSALSINSAINALTSRVEEHDRTIAAIKTELTVVKNQSVTRAELLETLKRVELQLQLMMLQAGQKQKIKIAEQ